MENEVITGGSDNPITETLPAAPKPQEVSPETELKKPKKEKKPRRVKQRRPERKLKIGLSIAMLAVVYLITAVLIGIFLAGRGQAPLNIAGAALILFMGYGAFGMYGILRQGDTIRSFSRMLLICVLLLVAVLPLMITMSIDIGFMPYLLAVLLMALLVNEKLAILAALPTASAAWLISGALGAADSAPVALFITVVVTAILAVLTLRLTKTRSSTVISSGLAGIAGVITYCAAMLAGGEMFFTYWQTLLWILGSCLVCGILAVGLMPVFEIVFDIASDSRLNELLNNNNPLIKRMMTEASGTYHHSLIVATLAEAAAEEIGANALLCRVCACYHDVGKLSDPLCFKENQRGDRNMHDALDPYESARRIIAHQQNGVELLEKYRLPGEVIRIVGEHHGDSVMVYFYDKAKKMAPEGTQVDENAFRYPSHKPSTKESAILMLADCCEAAVRSMNNPSMQEIAAKVREVITHKWDKWDSMLWDSPLTLVEIKTIEASFLRTFAALYHERVEYPDLERIDVR